MPVSIHNIPYPLLLLLIYYLSDIELIREAEHFIYIENQFLCVHSDDAIAWFDLLTVLFSISATKDGEQIVNKIAEALVERIIRAHRDGNKFKVFIAIPELPGFAGNVKDESSLQFIMAGQYRTINRGGSSIYEQLWKAGIEPYVSTFFAVRLR